MRHPKVDELDVSELRLLRHVSKLTDDTLEESLRLRESLGQTFHRLLPPLREAIGAKGLAVTTRNEELIEQTWIDGAFPEDRHAGTLLAAHKWGAHRVGADTLITQELDVSGSKVGVIGLLMAGDHAAADAAGPIARVLDAVAEQLDTVLATIHTASEKHQLILLCNELLANPVFEAGMDQTVLAIAQRERLPRFLVLYRDAIRRSQVHYRLYREGHLEFESTSQPMKELEGAIAKYGPDLINQELGVLRDVLGDPRASEAVLIGGVHRGDPMGKIIVWGAPAGFSAYTLDMVQFLASTLSQRMIDYNRERIHLSQFFSALVIDELLKDPRYEHTYLTPRDEQVGILFADINGFTRICEHVLETPARIGGFVDRWSDGVVEILWKHGGVFDKMVGDCVIGLFGPPFFRSSAVERAEATARAALEIQEFTRGMSADPEVARIAEMVKLPGLGVAIGVNLAHTYCGLFGPNQQYTGFSTGMNQTARLQALGGFREILVMDSLKQALEKSGSEFARKLAFGPVTETPVKNVAQPLRYCAMVTATAADSR